MKGDTFRPRGGDAIAVLGAEEAGHGAHPVVVDQRHYLVMEYLDGPDLSEAATQAGGALAVYLMARAKGVSFTALASTVCRSGTVAGPVMWATSAAARRPAAR